MDTKNVPFTDKHGKEWAVMVSEATALIGMRRSVMRRVETGRDIEEIDVANAVLRSVTYPDLVSCVVSASGFGEWPVGYAEFAGLPDQFVVKWETAVYDLNPHWLPGESEDDLKKTVIGPTDE